MDLRQADLSGSVPVGSFWYLGWAGLPGISAGRFCRRGLFLRVLDEALEMDREIEQFFAGHVAIVLGFDESADLLGTLIGCRVLALDHLKQFLVLVVMV